MLKKYFYKTDNKKRFTTSKVLQWSYINKMDDTNFVCMTRRCLFISCLFFFLHVGVVQVVGGKGREGMQWMGYWIEESRDCERYFSTAILG